MRMWNVNPRLMCRQHLLGEHLEMHMFIGCITKNKNIDGYINNGFVETDNIINRHEELVVEMTRRSFNHKSLITEEQKYIIDDYNNTISFKGKIDVNNNIKDLCGRCIVCRTLMS